MKIIFLNVLDAELGLPLRQFLEKHKPDTDVWCLQECYTGAEPILHELFSDYGRVGTLKSDPSSTYSFANVILARSDWHLESSGSNASTTDTGLVQYATLRHGEHVVHVGNVHGLSRPGKQDTSGRLAQSQEILERFAQLKGPHIIGGDFNIMPDTQSAQMFKANGYRDLIAEFNIETTRNHVAWDKHPGNELMYSDYVFTKDVAVKNFVVPSEIVSDHQPLIVTLDLDTQ